MGFVLGLCLYRNSTLKAVELQFTRHAWAFVQYHTLILFFLKEPL